MSETPKENTIPKKWFEKRLLGQYSLVDFARTGIAIIFIMILMSGLTIYLHDQVEKVKKSNLVIEYVNMLQEDVYNEESGIIQEAPDLVIDRILEFPISYDRFETHAYILKDASPEANGARYLYVHNEKGFAITRYWSIEELVEFKGHVHDQIENTVKEGMEKQITE